MTKSVGFQFNKQPAPKVSHSRDINFALLITLFLISALILPAEAAQHPIIEKIILQSKSCQPNYYFSPEEIESKQRHLAYLDKTAELLQLKNADRWYLESERLNLIPVNRCIIRGNKEYIKPENQNILKVLNVNTIVNTDFMAHNIVAGKTYGFKYTFVPINPAAYPKGESIISIMNAFNAIAQATPNERVYISCFHGKHRTSLLAAMYQFLGEYAIDPDRACDYATTQNDKAWEQAVLIANLGVLTYNVPNTYKHFYADFTKSVCEEKSDKFFQKLGA